MITRILLASGLAAGLLVSAANATTVVNTDNNYQKGLDAVIDCLLLSRTQFLIRTASNLSLCAAMFNSRVPDLLLNPER